MAIKIIEEPDIYITAAEHARLSREYAKSTSYMVDPPTFDEFVRQNATNQRAELERLRTELYLGSDAPLTACPIPGNGEICESCQ